MELRKSGMEFGSCPMAQEFWRQDRPRTGSGIGHIAKDENAA
jgi:hypothetical protein